MTTAILAPSFCRVSLAVKLSYCSLILEASRYADTCADDLLLVWTFIERKSHYQAQHMRGMIRYASSERES